MLVQDLDSSAGYKLGRINSLLEHMFGISIDYSNTRDHLEKVFEHYRAMRSSLIQSLGISDLHTHPQYTKAVLISEAVRIYLREIAPKRNRKRKR